MNRLDEKTLMGRLDGFREKLDFQLSHDFDSDSETYILEYVVYLLWIQSRAEAFSEMKGSYAAFLSGLREQVLRCPLSEKSVNKNMKIRGLIKYGVNLVSTPYSSEFVKPAMRDRVRILRNWIGFIRKHPGEIPFILVDFFRIVKQKQAEHP